MALTAFNTISTLPLLVSSFSLMILINGITSQATKYKVAVFEHAVIGATNETNSRESALEVMRKNIDIYDKTVIEAKKMGVKLLTFPEYGIYGIQMTRKRISLFAETIPDPKNGLRNPCEEAEFKGQSTEVLRMMSCIARDNKMFLVVNMAAREICKGESGCPSDDQYLYNTNVVFSQSGQIVARYYKRHLYEEYWFNAAKTAEAVIFDTPFGKFATFICFDVLFKDPAINLVEKYNVTNIASSVAWVKTPPILRSIQMHSSFARGVRVNFLVANIHLEESTSHGSGIYTPEGVANYYYRPNMPGSKLIVADISQSPGTVGRLPENPEKTQKEENIPVVNQYNLNNLFKFQILTKQSGSVKICHRSFCCKASYAVKSPFQEKYGLGVYNGYTSSSNNKLYFQVCALLKCPSAHCGNEISNVETTFTNISVERLNPSSKYVFPSVLSMDGPQYALVPNDWNYSEENGIKMKPGKTINLHSANLFGRVYSWDILEGDKNDGSRLTLPAYIEYIFDMVIDYVARIF